MDEFDKCLKRRSLVRIDYLGPDACRREIEMARSEIGDMDLGMANGRFKLATVSAYYAMFHSARALVLAKGYAEKSHFCLGIAFETLYGDVEDTPYFAAALTRARSLREHADYQGEFDEETARSMGELARRFVEWAAPQIEV